MASAISAPLIYIFFFFFAASQRWEGTDRDALTWPTLGERWADVVSWDKYELPLGTVFHSPFNLHQPPLISTESQKNKEKKTRTNVRGHVRLLASVALSHSKSIKIISSNFELQALKSAFFFPGSCRADLWFITDDKRTCRAAEICIYCSHLPVC